MAQYPGVVFVASAGSIEVDGNSAKVRSYTSEVYDQNGVAKRDRGCYDDRVVREEGVGRFRKRSFRNIHRNAETT